MRIRGQRRLRAIIPGRVRRALRKTRPNGAAADRTDRVPIDTDADWEAFGSTEPYHGVLTNQRYLRDNLDDEARSEFFATGEGDVERLFDAIRAHLVPDFAPRSVLDFGCGVGRNLIAFARRVDHAVGVDVSTSMLGEARANSERLGMANVELVESDDRLSRVSGSFDLVHTLIVLQHVPVARGEAIIRALLDRIAPGGVGAFQMTYEALDGPDDPMVVRPELPPGALPPMQMNRYDLNRVLGEIQARGVDDVFVSFTDHGGHLGVILYFAMPAVGVEPAG